MTAGGVKVGVVIVAYRSTDYVSACLESIITDDSVTCIVVDNGRDPQCRDVVEQMKSVWGERVEYCDPGSNLGYGKACNLGVRLLPEVDFVAIVNPDVVLSVRLGDVIPLALNDGLKATVFAGRLGRGGWSNSRPAVSLVGELLKAVVGSRAYRRAWPEGGNWAQVGQLDGALLILPVASWNGLQGFDPRFDLYYEDVDLCVRAGGENGCWLGPDEWGEHAGGASFKRSGGAGYLALRVSRVRYLRKYYGAAGAAFGLVLTGLELVTRAAARCSEGHRARWGALKASVHEVANPGSVATLTGGS